VSLLPSLTGRPPKAEGPGGTLIGMRLLIYSENLLFVPLGMDYSTQTCWFGD